MKRWTARELDLRREAASASELAEAMVAEPGYRVPVIDWDRTTGKVMTMAWIDGIKISDRAALIAAGHDLPALAARLADGLGKLVAARLQLLGAGLHRLALGLQGLEGRAVESEAAGSEPRGHGVEVFA